MYAGTRAEEVIGRALAGTRRESTLQNPDVSAAIIGATRPEQVRENARELAEPPSRMAGAQLAGWRLIGPYSLRSSSSSVT